MLEQDDGFLGWYRSQIKVSKELAEKAKARGDSVLERYYTQESLNYLVKVRNIESMKEKGEYYEV